MKNLTFTLLILVWLQLLSFNLSAKNPEGRFNLKEGDWFEIRASLPYDFTNNSLSNLMKGPDILNNPFKLELTVLLRYQLQKQLLNGNQIYNVSIKRIQSKFHATGSLKVWYGYDSYYPNFQDNLNSVKQFIQFSMEVIPTGSICRFDSISGYIPEIKLVPISPKKEMNQIVSFSQFLPSNLFEIFSTMIVFAPKKAGVNELKFIDNNEKLKVETLNYTETELYSIYKIKTNDSITTEFKCLKKEGIPISTDNAKLVNASFPIAYNTLIKGKLSDQSNQEVVISLEGDYDEKYFEKQYFKTSSDGSFNCRLFLNKPYHLKIKIGEREVSSFIEPCDTLDILAIGLKVDRFYDWTTKPGYMINTPNFEGQAAYNAKLSIEMDEWISPFPLPNDVKAYQSYQKTIIENTNSLLSMYKGKASDACINYFLSRRSFFLAYLKLNFYEEQQRPKSPFNVREITYEYPSDFFAELDTIPTIMYPYEWCSYYRLFNEYSFDYRKNRLEMTVGGQNNEFYGNYYFARAALKGWPLYSSLCENIDKELRKGSVAADKIEPFYQDFMNNCSDPSLTEPLRKTHETLEGLAIGKTFPIESFVQNDSTEFDLAKYKGKPVCLAFMESPKRRINDFKREIDKFKSDEVEFIFVCLPNNYFDQSPVDSTLLAMPNVHVIDVPDKNLKDKILLSELSKIYMLDKWLRITDDNMLDPSSNYGDNGFKEAVEKAIKTKRFSKAEKTAMIKTTGWSLGSILFTFLIGLWVYKIRVRKLKQQEAAKRRIKELEIKAVRSQMNPHFIFNALNSIQSLINGNQFKEANIYLSKFAVLLRGVLNNSEKPMVTLSDELQAVELYCQLEQLRFEFKFEIHIDPLVDVDIVEIPGMIIQPLVENAIVHGLSSKGNEGKLTIRIEKQNGNLCVCVTDNGVGLDSQKVDELSQKGFGLKLVEERINILNLDGKEARLNIENRNDAAGTLATLIIPID